MLDHIICSSWDIEQNIQKFWILGQKSKFWKMKKFAKISSLYKCVPKITIIWCMVPEIQSETGRIFCHFGSFFALLTLHPLWSWKSKFWKKKMKKIPRYIILSYIHVYHKGRSYDISFLKYKVQQTKIFVILGHFLPFQSYDNLENQNLKIQKNTWRYYHFTHLHHTNVYHKWQSYNVWFPKYGVQQTELFVILDHFLPYNPLNNPKNQNFEITKKPAWILSVYICVL